MTMIALKTKQCPFCAETIQAAAVKCRFCGEFLNSKKAKDLEAGLYPDSPNDKDENTDDALLFTARPSLFGMAGTVVKGLFFLVLATLLMKLPLETVLAGALKLQLTRNQILIFNQCRFFAGLGLIVVVAYILLIRMIRLKMTYYEVSPARIEWSRGILDRKVDNLDMYRVIDLKMRRTVFDCIFGIGTVGLITTDKTEPEFFFEKVVNPRKLYDIIKKASLDADKQGHVVHLE